MAPISSLKRPRQRLRAPGDEEKGCGMADQGQQRKLAPCFRRCTERFAAGPGIGYQDQAAIERRSAHDPGGVEMRDRDLGHGEGRAPGDHQQGQDQPVDGWAVFGMDAWVGPWVRRVNASSHSGTHGCGAAATGLAVSRQGHIGARIGHAARLEPQNRKRNMVPACVWE